MARKQLTGTLEEQCGFLYQLAQEKMASGNYTGAVYALKEIIKYKPDYGDAALLLEKARQHKKAQTFRLVVSLVGASIFVGIGSGAGLDNDLWLFAFAFAGLLVGYVVANLVRGQATY
ncbi:MAG: hypothetical protein F4X14_06820 [Caldilineaceae bacterium SB0661_bin_32]|uniref:Tetratricopeptide repeat protein n=1 Tax=Caldilineaceae bacterium SB0661_bin_32 TaxID=2605255 RepID=A0A6B1D501_9CHLR|nr:hypothetical protein [Caldilineaceae bacterium SB0661_bin_32]